MRTVSALLSAVAAFSLAGSAAAQTRPPAPPSQPAPPSAAPVGAEPQQTTAVYGDWALRCVRQGEGAQARRSCEVSQSLQAQGQAQALAQIAIGRPEPGQPMRFVALLPPNVAFPSSVRVGLDEADQQPVELIWRRCLPGACVADVETTQAMLTKLRSRNEGGRLTFREAAGRDVALPISLRGLAQALDALAREG